MSIEDTIEKEIKRMNLTEQEIKELFKGLKTPSPHYNKRINLANKHFKFGYFSDAHMGHKNYRPDVLDHAIRNWNKQGVEFIINSGDTVEGMSGRDGHIYELSYIGASDQLKYASEQLNKIKQPIYSIEADSSHGGWFKSKANMGLDIGEELELRVKNYKFLGYDEQDLKLDNGLIIRLRHPGGGSCYAHSHKMQKYVDSLLPEDKPDIVVQGHFHKSCNIFYKGIHGIDAGALQSQSPFMKKKGTPSHVGYGVIEVYYKSGIERLIHEWVGFE